MVKNQKKRLAMEEALSSSESQLAGIDNKVSFVG